MTTRAKATKTLGRQLLNAYLEQIGGGQKRLGDAIGVNQSTISLWKRGKMRPEADHRVLLKRVAGIPEESWLTGKERREMRELQDRITALHALTGTEN